MPWFVNWDDYKTNFEQEAGRILGHPVTVGGSANASILPSPSLTFADVRVGPADQPPMMTVERFEVTIELMPLLQGEIRVTSMRLDAPVVRIGVDTDGAVDWMERPVDAEALEPDKVALSAVTISGGAIAYSDARTGVGVEFTGITAAVEARSLAGPWRAEGSYRDGGAVVPFQFATGRRLEDGTIRLTAAVSPVQWPVDVRADGVVRHDPLSGLVYAGTYVVSELVENVTGEAVPEGEAAATSGWRSEGAFSLGGERLSVDKAVLSHGPPDRPTSLAGALTLDFGDAPSFAATAEARQLDLDRAFGGGPTEPVEVAGAAERLVAWLTSLPIPDIPGRIDFDVPAIVVGGSVIQDVAFSAAPAAAGWEIAGLRARLPGQASIAADGVLATDRAAGFVGSARLAVLQPATFASWWRGGAHQGAGRLLSAFDLSGTTEIAQGRISVDNIDARIGDATITGRFAWSEAQRTWHRHLGTDLKADRIDFSQVKALAELLVGRDLTDLGVLADSYSVILATGAFQFDDIRMTDVAVNAEYSDDVLKIVRFSIGDLDGANFRVTSGRIDQPTTNPRGELTAELEATGVDGLALIAGRFFPDSGLFEWLGRTADVITPAFVSARIVAPPEPDGSGFRVTIEDGVAGQTTFDVLIESGAARIANWRDEPARLSAAIDSPDSAALARQIGLAATSATSDGGSHIEIEGAGVPSSGLDTTVIADVAGVTANVGGSLAFGADLSPTFSGDFGVSAFDIGSLIATAGMSIPDAMDGTAVELDGSVDASDGRVSLTWRNGRIAERSVSGTVAVSRGADRGWRLDGDLAVDEVDLGWAMSLGLGRSPLPTGDVDTPWSREPFSAPGYGMLSGKLAVAAERVTIGDSLSVSNARLALALQPQRIDVDLTQGHLAGGSAVGGVSIHSVAGNANITGQFVLSGASLESLVWRLDERAVATGIVDLSANLEATGSSPAGLVSSMTGGGVVSISDGEARYVDPTFGARQIVRASDLGQEFSEDALRIVLGEQIDASTLKFGETGGAFTVAAGTVRMRGLAVRAANAVEATGNALVDLNTMMLDSDWTLTFDPGDTVVQGIDPTIGIVFRGPLARPTRTIDALPFGSYLNTRREARMLEIIAREEADRVEREWFGRVALKLRQDSERAERLAAEAAERARLQREIAAAAALRLDRLHAEREVKTEELAVASLARWIERVVAESEQAAAAAIAAGEIAAAERERADALVAALPALVATEEDAEGAAAAVEASFAERQAVASAAAEAASRATAVATEAEAEAELAAERAEAERQAATAADRDRASAAANLEQATQIATAARSEVAAAEAEAAEAARQLDEAGRAVSDAFRARDAAAQALRAAEDALAGLEASAQESGVTQAEAARIASAAMSERDRLQATAVMAAMLASDAEAALEEAANAVRDAEKQLTAAEAAFADATKIAADAAGVAEALAGDSDDETLVMLEGAVQAAELRKAARKADVDRLTQVVELARAELATASAGAASSRSRANDAEAALDAATVTVAEATAAAEDAVAGNAARLNALTERMAARDAALQESDARAADAQAAGAQFNEAEVRAQSTADRAETARAAAATAEAAEAEAASAVTTSAGAAESHGSAAEAAATASAEAAAQAVRLRSEADAALARAVIADADLAEVSAAMQAATAEAEAARAARVAAEAEAAAAFAVAEEAEAAARDAAGMAEVKAAEAAAAARRPSPDDADSETAAVPPPRPRRQPINLVPEAIGGDQPLVIVPVQ